MRARIEWLDAVGFEAETGSGAHIVMDGPEELGGKGRGARPMELLLVGLGGCTAFDVVTILAKARQQCTGCVVEVEAERAETVPKVFTRIHLHYRIRGRDLSSRQVERAVKLSKEKYCSASLMLAQSVEITYEVTITEEGG